MAGDFQKTALPASPSYYLCYIPGGSLECVVSLSCIVLSAGLSNEHSTEKSKLAFVYSDFELQISVLDYRYKAQIKLPKIDR